MKKGESVRVKKSVGFLGGQKGKVTKDSDDDGIGRVKINGTEFPMTDSELEKDFK